MHKAFRVKLRGLNQSLISEAVSQLEALPPIREDKGTGPQANSFPTVDKQVVLVLCTYLTVFDTWALQAAKVRAHGAGTQPAGTPHHTAHLNPERPPSGLGTRLPGSGGD